MFFGACGEDPIVDNPTLVTGVEFDSSSITLLIGDTYELEDETSVTPADASNKKLRYISQNVNIATIDASDGTITAIASGVTTVLAQATDGTSKQAYMAIRVQQNPTQLTAPLALTIEENILSWQPVSNALGYIVNINGTDRHTLNLTQYEITTFGDTRTYKIQAIGDENAILSSAYSQAIQANILSSPTNVSNNTDVVSWDSVTGAESYEIWINGAIVETEETTVQLNLTSAQIYQIKIRAVSIVFGVFPSLYTEALQIERLAVPAGVAFQQSGFVWNSSLHASTYTAEINGMEEGTPLTNYKLPEGSPSGAYTFRVKAVGNGTNILDSEYSLMLTTTKLEGVEDVYVEDGILKWLTVSNANSYTLTINSQQLQVSVEGYYSLDSAYGAGLYTISVVANGNGASYMNSNSSSTLETTKLGKIANIGVIDGVISWLPTLNATHYSIRFDEEEHTSNELTYDIGNEVVAGEYQVAVRAEADGFLRSEYTDEIIVERLETPQNFRIENGLLRWDSVAYTSYYEIVAGAETINAGLINGFKLNLPPSSYDIKVRSRGDNTRYLTSEFTETVTATKLDTPTFLGLDKGYIDIIPVPNASNYVLEVNGLPYIMSGDSFPFLLNATPEQTHNITMFAIGDSIMYLNSNYIDSKDFYQLPNVQNFTVEDGILRWDSIAGASEYEVYIKDQIEEHFNEVTDLTVASSNFFDLSSTPIGQYTAMVRGRGDSITNLTTASSEYIDFEILDTPQNFRISNGILVWDSVHNASGYTINIDDSVAEVISGNRYILDDSYPEGIYSIKIATYGNGINFISSDYTDVIIGDKTVAPTNLKVSDGTVETFGTLIWDEVPDAIYYMVNIAGGYFRETETMFDANYSYIDGIYDAKVYAVKLDGILSDPSNLVRVEKLAVPANLRVEGSIIKWDSVLNSEGYYLYINEDTITIDSNEIVSYDFNEINYDNYAVGTFNVSIRAIGDSVDKLNSHYSENVAINVMAAPSGLNVSGGRIAWNSVDGALEYELSINDVPLIVGDINSCLLPDSYEFGAYDLKIKAIGNDSTNITSAYSNIFSAIRLDHPENLGLDNGKVDYDTVANSDGYLVLVTDEENYEAGIYVGTATTYELNNTFISANYDIAVRAVGDDTIYLTSVPSPQINADKINIVIDFKIEDGILKWTPNSEASEYILKINDGTYYIGIVNSYSLPDNLVQTGYEIKIKARGDSVNKLNSNYTNTINATKMDMVTNLKVEDGIIKWDGVTAPDGYTIKISDGVDLNYEEILSSGTSQYVLDELFAPDAYEIYVQTNGNDLDNLNSVNVGNIAGDGPLLATKLEQTANITLSGDDTEYTLSWDQKTDANTYRLIMIKAGVSVVDEEINPATDYTILQSLEEGVYFVTVQTMGDDTDKLNADVSDSITITKPESAADTIQAASGVATWDASIYDPEYISYELTIILDGNLQPVENTDNNYYYLTELGYYEIFVVTIFSNSLESDPSITVEYDFDLFNSGDGDGSPFEIVNETQLNNVKYNPTANYIVTNDITLTASNFEPIGTLNNPFTGTFDGGSYYIDNLSIQNVYSYSGMFAYISESATVKNFTLNNVSITSPSQYTGAVAGYNAGYIYNINVVGDIDPTLIDSQKDLYAGGIAGYNSGEIERAITTGAVTPTNTSNVVYAGGITGYNNGYIFQSGNEATSSVIANFAGGITGYNNGDIEECYNKGSVTANSFDDAVDANAYAGGIAGLNLNNDVFGGYTGRIINCYNAGIIAAYSDNVYEAYAGGITGLNSFIDDTNYGEVYNCYNVGNINASAPQSTTYIGGITGNNLKASKLSYSYYLDSTASVVSISNPGITSSVKDDTQMKLSSFKSLLNESDQSPSDIWDYQVDDYPKLAWEL